MSAHRTLVSPLLLANNVLIELLVTFFSTLTLLLCKDELKLVQAALVGLVQTVGVCRCSARTEVGQKETADGEVISNILT